MSDQAQVDGQLESPAAETETIESVEQTQSVEQKGEQATEPDYSWVPPKFIKDGQPDFQNLAKSYQNLETRLGKKGAIPPESIDAYEYSPKTFDLEPERVGAFKEEALKNGLSTEQYQWLMSKYESAVGDIIPSRERAETTLRSAWGDDFESKMRLANKAFQEFAPSDVSLEEVGNNTAVIKLLAQIGAELREDSAPKNGSAAKGLSKEDIEKVMSEPDYYSNLKKQKLVQEWYAQNRK